MTDRLKDLFFSDLFITELGSAIKGVYPDFNLTRFNHLIYSDDLGAKELKQKMHHITQCMVETLPEEYPQALKILSDVAPNFEGFNALVFPDFVERCGMDDWELSMPALALFTKLCSSEFAIRPFLAKDPERAMAYLYKWAEDENFHLRRLASEGCRPRLPWAMSLPMFKEDPTPLIRILETLKNDPEEYVQKSVANNLNDISKDHPDRVLDICERWYGHSSTTDRIVKRACRTLLKDGNTRALVLFGFGDPAQIEVCGLEFDHQSLPIGEELRFSFTLNNNDREIRRVRIEYGVDYVKFRDKISRKMFQIKESDFEPGSHIISKKHSFRDLSTRKHYTGQHTFIIFVNGKKKSSGTVNLV